MKTMFLLMTALCCSGVVSAQQLLVKTSSRDTTAISYSLPFTAAPEDGITPLLPPNGSTWASIPISTPRFGYLFYGNKRYALYFEPGKRTVVNFAGNPVSPRFEGALANENTLLNTPAFKTAGHPLYDSLSKLPVLSPAALQSTLEKLRAEKLAAFAMLAQKSAFSSDFAYLFNEELVYYYENIFYDFFNHWYRRDNLGDTALRNQWFAALGEMLTTAPVINEKALVLPEYKAFLNSYYRYGYNTRGRNIAYVEKLMGKSKEEIMALVKESGSELPVGMALSHDFFKEQVGAYYAVTQVKACTETGSINLESALRGQALYDSLYPASPYQEELARVLQPIRDFMALRTASPQLTYYGHTAYPSLEDVLKKFKGKVIYLDAWATWCGYCQEEFTSLPELKKRFGDEIVYLYVSIDEDQQEKEWENLSAFFKLEGHHYRVGNRGANYDRLLQIFGKKASDGFGIPAYAIINRQGEVVVNNAFRPGNKEQLYQQLEKYIQP